MRPSFPIDLSKFLLRLEKYRAWAIILKKDPCTYCGRRMKIRAFTREHVLPISAGGRGGWENLVGACCLCNVGRSSRGLLMYLVNPPKHVLNHWKQCGSPFYRGDK